MLLNQKGITFIELLAVLIIIAIVTLIVIPAVMTIIDKAEDAVCTDNLNKLKRDYGMHLSLMNVQHSEILFDDYYNDWNEGFCVCRNGESPYVEQNGEILCTDKEDDEPAPIL
ncbi:type II secretion system protein [Salisediminibacterium selenitireducens]|uniref:Prepilin-type N-terminal cleavage/methylation domain-containing protein n=1 Tax=Bacillus selenitireducens (strain ATCC 700615 / DSM 15326 / MLS10) TaxID=439292 RepID=D6Y028_BACIE|nr:type II secretion system protein [Salisediminibacterium selenitireducens]ADI00530.1 hypothetical protein Bsel_3048 [[Bacillus] selenitireducens MLS10]